MRVSSVLLPVVSANITAKGRSNVENKQSNFSVPVNDLPYTNVIPANYIRILKPYGISSITFTGDTTKNINQVASLCYENKGTGLAEDFQGGLGVVTYEAPQSMNHYEGMDVRSFSPFHEHANVRGGYRFLFTRNLAKVDGRYPDEIEAKYFVSADPGQSREELAKALKCEPSDLRFVIQGEPNAQGSNGKSKYVLIEPTSVNGEFERMSDTDIGKLRKVYYELFTYATDNPPYVKLANSPNYWVYTQELAKIPKPYTYGPEGNGGMVAEIVNSDYCRAVKEMIPKMNTEEFGFYNPASFWGHDRPVMWFASFVADESARGNSDWDGVITHNTMHNPRRTYQGTTDNPFEFARAIFSKEDVEAIAKHPQYKLLQNFSERGWGNLSPVEKDFVTQAFDPFIGKFKDFFGTYNITKIGIIAKMANPKNASLGTVSPAFEEQMKDPNMDVAPGLGEDLRNVEMVSPLNGSTPANLGLDNNTDDFGRGSNILSEKKSGFTPLSYNGENIEEIIANREKNAQWFVDILKEAEAQGQDKLNRVLYNEMQISQGRSVIGSISDYKPGDMLVVGWGRPDPQKGFPISVEAAYKFFARPDIPEEIKSRTFFVFGWGDLPFDKNSREWHLIDKSYKKLLDVANGKYAKHILLGDGRISNKALVGCASHSLLTSRDEICGITPFESMSGGVPYGTTAAGGPKGYTDETVGWKTKTAPEMNPEFDGLSWDTPADVLDDARVARSSDEVADMLADMSNEYFNDKNSYIERCKTCIERKVDWHNNDALNGGISANQSYKNTIWHIDEGWEAREKNPLNRLVGRIAEAAETREAANSGVSFGAGENSILKTLESLVAAVKQLTEKVDAGTGKLEINTGEVERLSGMIDSLDDTVKKNTTTPKQISDRVSRAVGKFRKALTERIAALEEQSTKSEAVNEAISSLSQQFEETVASLKDELAKVAKSVKEHPQSAVTTVTETSPSGNKWTNIIIGTAVGAAAVGSAVYAYMSSGKAKSAFKTEGESSEAKQDVLSEPKSEKEQSVPPAVPVQQPTNFFEQKNFLAK